MMKKKKKFDHGSTAANNADNKTGPVEFSTIRFSEYPLKVQINPSQKDSRSWIERNFTWCFLIFMVLISCYILVIWWWYTFPQKSVQPVSLDGDLKDICIGFTTPSNVIMESEHNIDVTVLNNSENPFSGTIIMAFSQFSLLSIAGDGSTFFELKDIPPQAQVTRRIGFIVNEPHPEKVLEFQLRVQTRGTCGNGTTGWQILQVVRFSLLKYMNKYLISFITFLLGIMGTLLIDICKEYVFK